MNVKFKVVELVPNGKALQQLIDKQYSDKSIGEVLAVWNTWGLQEEIDE